MPLEFIEKAIRLGLATKSDLICLAGDFATRTKQYDLSMCVPVLKRLGGSAPTFAVLGNHDGGQFRPDAADIGPTTRSLALWKQLRLGF